MNYIERTIESFITEISKSFKGILVTGNRQTGKSTLFKHLFPNLKVISFDDLFLIDLAHDDPITFMMLNQPPIFLDEFQYVPSLLGFIKKYYDQNNQKGLFVLSCSRSYTLSYLETYSLENIIAIIELAPLSLREIMGDRFNKPFVPTLEYIQERSKTSKQPNNIWEIIHKGGYPELYNSDVRWNEFYANYLRTYLERDVREQFREQNLEQFRKFMVACATRTGQMMNLSNIAQEVEINLKTIRRWIYILESTGIIFILKPFSNSILISTIKTPKLYFRDTGLAAYLTRWLTPETLEIGYMNGAFFETFVISEILKSYSNQGLDYHYFVSYYRGIVPLRHKVDGTLVKEYPKIDLIIEQGGTLYPIEIIKGSSVSLDQTFAYKVLDDIPNKKRGMGAIISMNSTPSALRDNILQIPCWYI